MMVMELHSLRKLQFCLLALSGLSLSMSLFLSLSLSLYL